jgi:hypothetical protein
MASPGGIPCSRSVHAQPGRDLHAQGVRPQAVLDLVPRVMGLELQTRAGSVALEVRTSDTVVELRQRLARAPPTRGRFAVLWRGQPLAEGAGRASLRGLGVAAGDALQLQPLPLEVRVRLPCRGGGGASGASGARPGAVASACVDPDRGTAADVKAALAFDPAGLGLPPWGLARALLGDAGDGRPRVGGDALFWLEWCAADGSTSGGAPSYERLDDAAPLPHAVVADALLQPTGNAAQPFGAAASPPRLRVCWARLQLRIETPTGRAVEVRGAAARARVAR